MPRILNNAALLWLLAPGLAHAQQDAQGAAEQVVRDVGGERLRIPRSAFEALADLLEIRHYAPRR